MTKVTYGVADLINGVFETYSTEEEARKEYAYAVDDGTSSNLELVGEEGCPWQGADDCRKAAEEFFYIVRITEEVDEDGDIETTEEVI